MNDALTRMLAVAAGSGDPDLLAELLQPESPARQLADAVGRLNAQAIDLTKIPGLADVLAAEEAACMPDASPAPAPQPGAHARNGVAAVRLAGTQPPPRLRRKAFLVASFALLALTGMSWGAWVWLTPEPLLFDRCDRRWFDATVWHSDRPIVRAERGYLALLDRGAFHSREEFHVPIALTFEWRWRDLAGYPHYGENFSVALRTTGAHVKAYPFEAADGVVVNFLTYPARIDIITPLNTVRLAATRDGAFPFAADEWHRIRITDDGETIAVYVQGPEIDRKYTSMPALSLCCPDKGEGHCVGFYNREMVGGVPHESHIRNIKVHALPIERAQ